MVLRIPATKGGNVKYWVYTQPGNPAEVWVSPGTRSAYHAREYPCPLHPITRIEAANIIRTWRK